MIAAVACVPQAPLLLPGLTGRPDPEVERLRAAAQQAIAVLRHHGIGEIVILGGARSTAPYPPGAPAPVGRLAPAPGRPPERDALPVSLAVGRALLTDRSMPVLLQGVQEDASPEECRRLGGELAGRPARTGLVVAADGSARRGPKAPGYVDPRAFEVDDQIAKALNTPDPQGLLALDPGVCADLLIAGRAAWQVMAAACSGDAWRADARFSGDPFGVAYHVLTWTPGS